MSRGPDEMQTDGKAPAQTAGTRMILEIDAEELDEVSGGFLPGFGRSTQPDGGGSGAHH